MLGSDVVEDQIESQRDPAGSQHGGQIPQILDAAEIGAHRAIIHDRIAAIVLAGPWLEQRHEVQIGDAQLGEIIHPIGDTLQVAGEKVGVGGVSQHLRMLKPLRIGVPPQVQQSQVGGPLLEVLRGDLHQTVGHLRRMVRVGARQAGQQIRPIALQSCRKDDLIMRRLALQQRRHVRNTHRCRLLEQALACQQFAQDRALRRAQGTSDVG